MKAIYIFILMLGILFSGFTNPVIAQEVSPSETKIVPEHIKVLESEINDLRLEGIPENQALINQKLQVVNAFAGFKPSATGNIANAGPVAAPNTVIQGDLAQGLSEIIALDSYGYATATEQTGVTAGRIWAAIPVLQSATITDYQLRMYFSDDHGGSWTYYAFFPALANQNLPTSIDIEIIEDPARPDKYIYGVFDSFNTSISQTRSYLYVVQTNAIAGTTQMLNWSTLTNDDKVFNARITSDNSKFITNPWVYISATVDSLTGGANRNIHARFARVTGDVFQPAITNLDLQNTPVFWQNSTTAPSFMYNDIAFVDAASDPNRIIVAQSNFSGNSNTRVWLSNINITGTDAKSLGILETADPTYLISGGQLASPGGVDQDQLMVVARSNFQNSGDYDIDAWKTNDYGSNWERVYADFAGGTTTIPANPSIVCERGEIDGYHLAFSYGPPGTTFFPGYNRIRIKKQNAGAANSWGLTNELMPGFNVTNPKAGFNLSGTTDQCFALFARSNGILSFNNPVYAMLNCDPTVGIDDLSELYESNVYPNPFASTFRIVVEFGQSTDGEIKIFNNLGQLIKQLAFENEYLLNKSIDLSNVPSGHYFLQIYDTKGNHLVRQSLEKF